MSIISTRDCPTALGSVQRLTENDYMLCTSIRLYPEVFPE